MASYQKLLRHTGQRSVRAAAASLAMALSVVFGAGAQVDQENWDANPLIVWWPEQQEFTPTFDKLDSVQLFMIGDLVALRWPGGACSVNIRQGGFNGPVIAASRPTYVAYAYDGPVGFGFTQPVPLVPGQLYSLEPITDIRRQPAFGTTSAVYPSGRFFGGLSGQPIGGTSLVFREGIGLEVVPEPAPVLLIIVGLFMAVCYSVVAPCIKRTQPEPEDTQIRTSGCSEPGDSAPVPGRRSVAPGR